VRCAVLCDAESVHTHTTHYDQMCRHP